MLSFWPLRPHLLQCLLLLLLLLLLLWSTRELDVGLLQFMHASYCCKMQILVAGCMYILAVGYLIDLTGTVLSN